MPEPTQMTDPALPAAEQFVRDCLRIFKQPEDEDLIHRTALRVLDGLRSGSFTHVERLETVIND
jgi:hypothetical protein